MAECAGLISIPGGHWFCPRCKNQQNSVPGSVRKVTTKMRNKGGSKAGGPAVKESLDDRCTRLLKATDTVSSGCVFCRYVKLKLLAGWKIKKFGSLYVPGPFFCVDLNRRDPISFFHCCFCFSSG